MKRTQPSPAPRAVSKAQIAKIFTSAREIGMEKEQLYEVVRQVSGGESVRQLTDHQAREVIDVLVSAGARSGRASKPSGRRTAPNETLLLTPEQRTMILDLRRQLGMKWMEERYFEGACMRLLKKRRPTTAGDAARAIEMLKVRLRHQEGRAQ